MLHTFAPHAILPEAEVDALMARLTESGPTRAGDLAAVHDGDRRVLVRTILWLAKFDLVVLDPNSGAR